MKEIIYVSDPHDRVAKRCFDQSGNGITSCHRPFDHTTTTVITKIDDKDVPVEFNHRGYYMGKLYTW